MKQAIGRDPVRVPGHKKTIFVSTFVVGTQFSMRLSNRKSVKDAVRYFVKNCYNGLIYEYLRNAPKGEAKRTLRFLVIDHAAINGVRIAKVFECYCDRTLKYRPVVIKLVCTLNSYQDMNAANSELHELWQALQDTPYYKEAYHEPLMSEHLGYGAPPAPSPSEDIVEPVVPAARRELAPPISWGNRAAQIIAKEAFAKRKAFETLHYGEPPDEHDRDDWAADPHRQRYTLQVYRTAALGKPMIVYHTEKRYLLNKGNRKGSTLQRAINHICRSDWFFRYDLLWVRATPCVTDDEYVFRWERPVCDKKGEQISPRRVIYLGGTEQPDWSEEMYS